MNNDKELLELAAKAAGIADGDVFYDMDNDKVWNPLTDDGDALRLAVKLKMDMYFRDKKGATTFYAGAPQGEGMPYTYRGERVGPDAFAATRRAIVVAAARIGRGME